MNYFTGQTTRADLALYGDAANTNFTTFQLVSREGVVLFETKLLRVTETLYRPATSFVLPNELMVVVSNEWVSLIKRLS